MASVTAEIAWQVIAGKTEKEVRMQRRTQSDDIPAVCLHQFG